MYLNRRFRNDINMGILRNGHSYETQPSKDFEYGTEVIKLFSCSTQLNMKFCPANKSLIAEITNSFFLNIAEHENVYAYKHENANY